MKSRIVRRATRSHFEAWNLTSSFFFFFFKYRAANGKTRVLNLRENRGDSNVCVRTLRNFFFRPFRRFELSPFDDLLKLVARYSSHHFIERYRILSNINHLLNIEWGCRKKFKESLRFIVQSSIKIVQRDSK